MPAVSRRDERAGGGLTPRSPLPVFYFLLLTSNFLLSLELLFAQRLQLLERLVVGAVELVDVAVAERPETGRRSGCGFVGADA